MGEDRLELPHRLTLNERSALSVTGVAEVVSFDETAVVLKTTLGALIVQGRDLQLKTLSQDGGQVTVDGHVTSLTYEEPRTGGWARRLFG